MIYNDGFELDKNYRVIKCPKCGNETFSPNAMYCCICGTMLFNRCQSEWDNAKNEWIWDHVNIGSARFCEYCGKPTYFAIEKLLPDLNQEK